MKKRNIIIGITLAFSLTACYDLDKNPEGVLSTVAPFGSVGEMRNYIDQFYETGLRGQGFDAGGGSFIAGYDTHSDNMSSSSVSTRLAGETTLSEADSLGNYTYIRNVNFFLKNLGNCSEKGGATYNQYVGE